MAKKLSQGAARSCSTPLEVPCGPKSDVTVSRVEKTRSLFSRSGATTKNAQALFAPPAETLRSACARAAGCKAWVLRVFHPLPNKGNHTGRVASPARARPCRDLGSPVMSPAAPGAAAPRRLSAPRGPPTKARQQYQLIMQRATRRFIPRQTAPPRGAEWA